MHAIDLDPQRSIGQLWAQRAIVSGAATALIVDDETWSYEALYRTSGAAALLLHEHGVRQGERVLLMMENGAPLLAAFLGCQLGGVIAVPVSPRSSPARIEYLLADSGARCVLIEPALGTRSRALHEAQRYRTRLLEFTPPRTSGQVPVAAQPVGAGACALLQYTSGSTGDSKGVMISHRAAIANIRAFTAGMALRSGDVFSSLLPLCHDMGLMCFGLAPLLLGYPLVLYRAEALSLYQWLGDMSTRRVTVTGAPDSLLQIANRVVADPGAYSLATLRMLICGSEPVRRDTVELFGRRFGASAAIKPAYGMAELTLCATLTPAHKPMRVDAFGQVASGRPIEGVELRIETQNRTPAGEGEAATQTAGCANSAGIRGEILVRSPAAMSGYWARPEASARIYTADGFLRTGDLGYLDAEGYLYVVGRLKNMLVRGGEKYSPHDLETAAQRCSDIRRAAVVQLEHGSIVAVLEVDRGLLDDPVRLAKLAREYRRAAFAHAALTPDCCWFVGAGRIPTTENGKVRHAALRASIESGALQPIWADAQADMAVAAAGDPAVAGNRVEVSDAAPAA